MKKIIEVEGGFVAKEYDDNGSVISKSEVFATREEAEAGEVAQVEKSDKSETSQATPEAMVDPELKARTARAEDAPEEVTPSTGEQSTPSTEGESTEETAQSNPEVDGGEGAANVPPQV